MTIINALPFNLQNGTTADATQVMADFDEILNDVNNNAAHNGVNSDITALTALTTPIPPAVGGTNVFTGGTSTGTANAQVVAAPVPTGFTLTLGNRIVFEPGFTNIAGSGVTLAINGTTATAVLKPTASGLGPLTGGEIVIGQAAEAYFDGTQFVLFTNANPPVTTKFLQNYLAGLILSAAGATGTFGITAGEASDSTNAASLFLASAYTKTTASWTVGSGNGGLDTGSIANATWYHVHIIQNPTTGVVDILFSLSPTAPTLPSGYTLFRRIGSMKTDSSAHWLKFYQFGDEFIWDAVILEVSGDPITNVAKTYTLVGVPSNLTTIRANLHLAFLNTATGAGVVIWYAGGSNQAIGTVNFNLTNPVTNVLVATTVQIRMDSTPKIGAIASASTNNSFSITTTGWFDDRGRLS